jgi:dynein heavy chain
MHDTLHDVSLALTGAAVMSTDLEALATALSQSKVPAAWKAVSYPSVKPLASWVTDLLSRLDFFQKWIAAGPPPIFWLSGFFFTQSFLTGVRQNSARMHHIPIDELVFSFRVLPSPESRDVKEGTAKAPAEGALVEGLYLQGARWDEDTAALAEAAPRELFSPLPTMHLLPAKAADVEASQLKAYECPVYKTSERSGTLSTTGHSTNLIMMMQLPINTSPTSGRTAQHWVKRGVALISQLDV